jgi:hypothetical protein
MYANLLLKLFVSVGMTFAGILRFMNPEIGIAEMNSLDLLTPMHELLIALFELIAIPVMFHAPRAIRNLYLGFYCICIVIISAIYLKQHTIGEIKKLVPFTNDIKSIWYHLILVVIMGSIMLR